MTGKTIKRRSFFYFLGAAALGVYSLGRKPVSFFTSRFQKKTDIRVKENPLAIKREMNRKRNGA